MSDGSERELRDRQAMFAERLDVEVDAATGNRYVVLDGARLAQVYWLEAESSWEVLYASTGYSESHDSALGERENTEDADRHGIGTVAAALASGEITVDGRED